METFSFLFAPCFEYNFYLDFNISSVLIINLLKDLKLKKLTREIVKNRLCIHMSQKLTD